MLVNIRSGGATAAEKRDALDEMLGCHERIRRFSRMAGKLTGASGDDVVEGARAVHRYFTVALPLHAADEDLSFAPRLRAASPGDEVLRALEVMTREHEEIERALAELAPLWSDVVRDAATVIPHGAVLDEGAARLVALFDRHLGAEEALLFPAARRCFSADDLAELAAEMKARRA